MATVTHRVTTPSTSNTSSYATGAFTPSVGDLLVVAVTATGTVAAGSVSNSAGTTFTKITSAVKAASADTLYLFVANSLVSSATSQTCTFDCTGDAATGAIVSVISISGLTRTGASAVLKSAVQSNGAAAGTPTVSLGSAALTGNPLIGFVGNGTSPATLTQPSTWTELTDATGYATPTTGQEVVSINSGFTGSTVTWGSASSSAFGAIVAEFDVRAVAQNLTATRFDDTETIYSATVTTGSVGLTATRYDNSNTFYSATVAQPLPAQYLIASRHDNASTFYSAAITSNVTLTAGLFTNGNTFYQPTVNRGAVTLSASIYSNANVFYAPVIAKGTVTLNATLYSNNNTFYPASISMNGATQTLNASLFTNANSFYTASIKAGSVTLNAGLFHNANAFYAPSISIGGITLSLDIFVNANEFYSANIKSSYPQYLQSGLLTNINAFYPAKVIKVLAGRYPLAGMMKAYPVTIENSYALENEGRNYPVAGIKPSRPLKTHKHDRPNKGKK